MKTFAQFITEKLVNVGTKKWPLHAKASSKGKIANFNEPSNGKGDHIIQHEGETYTYTGKSGTHKKSGMASHEYRTEKDDRVWVRKDGHVVPD